MSSFREMVPTYGSTQQLTAAAGSLNAAINKQDQLVRIVNTGATNKVYVRTYDSLAAADVASNGVASAADYGVLPGTSAIIGKALNHDRVAYQSAAGTTLDVMTGNMAGE